MADLYKKFELEPETQDIIGHAMALQLDDAYLDRPARSTIDKTILYIGSTSRYGKSPYIYPLNGLGELTQSFTRSSAIYGGTHMMNQPADEIIYENGVTVGIRSGGQTACARTIICDPSYAQDKVKVTGKAIHAICVLKHPIPNTGVDSWQIVLPQNQLGRKHDTPEAGLELLGPISERFVSVQDIQEPLTDGTKDQVFISRSYDATSPFETVYDDVKNMYRRITGNDLDIQRRPLTQDDEDQPPDT
ncbi:unnamed protein product [Absidia cylindrospora]